MMLSGSFIMAFFFVFACTTWQEVSSFVVIPSFPARTASAGGVRLHSSSATTPPPSSDPKSIESTIPDAAATAAAAFTDFMAKAHDEKIAALARVEAKYREQIAALQTRVEELEGSAKRRTPTSGNSFAFPATNKELAEKIEAYRTFLSDYVVKAQSEKARAVTFAEDQLRAKYEERIADLNTNKSIQ